MKKKTHTLVPAAFLFGLSACTEHDLQLANFPVTVQGEYCTDDSEVYELPTRILLVIDTSKSMEINDPEDYRGRAAAELITHFSGSDTVSFGFIAFNTASKQVTSGFTRDPTELDTALEALNEKEGFTNYLGALGDAQVMVDADIAKVAEELDELLDEDPDADTRFVRPWYFVVFLSDGIPRMPQGVLQDTTAILRRVRDLVDVPPEAAGLTLHTAFLGSEDDEQRPAAEDLLKKMAKQGAGAYTSFESGEDIDFSVFDFLVQRRFNIKQFLLYNRSVVLTEIGPQPDTDQDGLSDAEEIELGTDLTNPDTDDDGCDDGFEVAAGIDPLKLGGCTCSADTRNDIDNDGILDCEETYLAIDKTKFDTDRDLFPDWLELRMGTNAADTVDQTEDLDFDGLASGQEIIIGTSPILYDVTAQREYGYRYDVAKTSVNGAPQTCYKYEIENVSLGNTQGTVQLLPGVNEVVLETIESPEDDPEGVFMLRRMVLQVEFGTIGSDLTVTADGEFETISTDQVTDFD